MKGGVLSTPPLYILISVINQVEPLISIPYELVIT
jgi:hypothetical protein